MCSAKMIEALPRRAKRPLGNVIYFIQPYIDKEPDIDWNSSPSINTSVC